MFPNIFLVSLVLAAEAAMNLLPIESSSLLLNTGNGTSDSDADVARRLQELEEEEAILTSKVTNTDKLTTHMDIRIPEIKYKDSNGHYTIKAHRLRIKIENNKGSISLVAEKEKLLINYVKLLPQYLYNKNELEKLTTMWQSGLSDIQIPTVSMIVEDDAVIFTFNNLAQALDAKNFLVQQEECIHVKLEGEIFLCLETIHIRQKGEKMEL